MTLLLTIIAFVVIFSLLILIHEFGHFWTARKFGVRVEEFGLGMGPKLWSFQPKKSDTVYTLNAIPFGGFVRLYGEDSYDKKAMAAKHSFAAVATWKKILIIVAGVVMNFGLAFFLLTFGFIIGIQPLFTSSDDVLKGIQDGQVTMDMGVLVKAPGANDIGFKAEDKILAVNGRPVINGDELSSLKDKEQVRFIVERAGQKVELQGLNDLQKPFFTLYNQMYLPEVFVKDVAANSALAKAGVQPGDLVKTVNGKQVFNLEDFEKSFGLANAKYQTVKGWSGLTAIAGENHQPVIIISEVLPGSPADKVGLKNGDEILSINGVDILKTADLTKALSDKKPGAKLSYKVTRDDVSVEYFIVSDERGLIGVLLSELHRTDNGATSYYLKTVPYSLKEIKNIQLAWYDAPGKALQEMYRLTGLTVQMFGNLFSSVVTRFTVPEGVSGPVGIAQMTYTFVQEGFMSLVRFTALLSLSLAIINILPFPGLDGGRLFLIIIPLILRKKLNPKLEAMIHLIGFLILMLLILMVTFNDILRFFVAG